MSNRVFKPITAGKATFLITITSLISYAMGLLRDRTIAHNFGTSSATDTYNASFVIPDMLFNTFIAGALAAAFLPVFSGYLNKDKEEAYKVANTMITVGTLFIGLISLIVFIFADSIIPIMFKDTDPGMQKDIIYMTRIILPASILFTISNTLGSILMSFRHFFSYSLSPILYNMGIIIGVVFFNESLGIYSAAIGTIVGAILHCLVRIFDTYATDFRFSILVDIKNPGFIKIIKLMIPKSISLLTTQINIYIFSSVGLQIVVGGVAAFNYARNIQSFAVSLFGIAFATAIFPYLASSASNSEHEKFTYDIQKTIQRILYFTLPSMVGLMLLTKPIVSLILGGGEFNENSIYLTSLLLFFFALSIPFESIMHILQRSFYAIQDTVTPMIASIVNMIVIAFITKYIAPIYGIQWFSIGFSIASVIQIIILFILLKKHLSHFKTKKFFISIVKIIFSCSIMGIFLFFSEKIGIFSIIKESIGKTFYTLIEVATGGGIYILFTFILKSEETSGLTIIYNKFFKKNENKD